MIFSEKHMVLKDGREAILRSPDICDAAAMLELAKITAGETDFLASYPEERTQSIEDEERWVAIHRESPLTVLIACFVGGEIVGSCELTRKKHLKMRHRALIGIAIKQAYWGLGIGSAMFREMIAMAREWGISQLELEYIAGNERGIRLYEKMGFRTVSEKPNAIRLKDGTMLSEFLMIRSL